MSAAISGAKNSTDYFHVVSTYVGTYDGAFNCFDVFSKAIKWVLQFPKQLNLSARSITVLKDIKTGLGTCMEFFTFTDMLGFINTFANSIKQHEGWKAALVAGVDVVWNVANFILMLTGLKVFALGVRTIFGLNVVSSSFGVISDGIDLKTKTDQISAKSLAGSKRDEQAFIGKMHRVLQIVFGKKGEVDKNSVEIRHALLKTAYIVFSIVIGIFTFLSLFYEAAALPVLLALILESSKRVFSVSADLYKSVQHLE